MSNCSNHRKDLSGQNDMQHVAEDIGNLHYAALANLLNHLSKKLKQDAAKDLIAGRKQLSAELSKAGCEILKAWLHIIEAWKICEPHMENRDTES